MVLQSHGLPSRREKVSQNAGRFDDLIRAPTTKSWRAAARASKARFVYRPHRIFSNGELKIFF